MKSRSPLHMILEYLAVGSGILLFSFLPRPCLVWLSRVLGTCAYRIAARERRIALANLDVAFGDGKTDSEKTEIAKRAFWNFSLLLLDYFWFSVFTRSRVERWVDVDPSIHRGLSSKPVMIVSLHYGNWEVSALRIGIDHEDVACVAKTIESDAFDGLVNRLRQKTGQKVYQREGAVKGILQTFKRSGIVSLLLDQNTLPEEGGGFVDFFGLPTPMSTVTSMISKKTDSVIVFGYCYPDSKGRYTMAMNDASPVHLAENPTQEVASQYESLIRERPEYWLWMYKRWKFRLEESPSERYPYYARDYKSPSETKSEV